MHPRPSVLGIPPRGEVTDASAPVVCSAWSTLAPLLPFRFLGPCRLLSPWSRPRCLRAGPHDSQLLADVVLFHAPPVQHLRPDSCPSLPISSTPCVHLSSVPSTTRYVLPYEQMGSPPLARLGPVHKGSFAQLNHSSHTKCPHFSIPRVGGASGCMTDAQLCHVLSGLSQAHDLPQAQCPWSQNQASSLHLLSRGGVRTMYPPPAAEPQADWAAPQLPSVGM